MATPKAVPTGLDALLPLLLQQTGSTSQTQTGTANTGPLQQVFNAASQPMDQGLYDNLIASIFQNAQKNVPQMTAALANATGSRSSNNSPLALALNEQNNQASQAAAQAILTQQNAQNTIAGNAASGIAQSTRGTQQRTQEKSGGPLDPLTGLLGGFALNKLDKSGVFDKIGSSVGGAVSSAFSSPDLSFLNNIAPSTATGFGGTGLDQAVGMFTGGGSGGAAASGSGFFDSFTAPDLTSLFSGGGGSSGFDLGSTITPWIEDAGSWLSDIGSSIGSFFGFADGGMIPAHQGAGVMGSRQAVIDGATDAATQGQDPNAAVKMILAQALTPRPAQPAAVDPNILGFLQYLLNTGPGIQRNQYADGGIVGQPDMMYADGGRIRNFNNMGGPRQRFGMGAINDFSSGAGSTGGSSGLNSQSLNDMILRDLENPYKLDQRLNGVMSSDSREAMVSSRPSTGMEIDRISGGARAKDLQNKAMATMAGFIHPALGIAVSLGTGNGISGSGPASLGKGVFNAAMQDRGVTQALSQSDDQLGSFMGILSQVGNESFDMSGLSPSAKAAAVDAMQVMRSSGSGVATSDDPLGDFIRSIPGLGQETWGSSSSSNFSSSGDSGGSGESSSSTSYSPTASYSQAGGFADGGMVHGRGTGTSDSIPVRSRQPGGPNIHYSAGEFVIPTDVVNVPGMRQHLETLLNSYHAPVRR